MHWTETYIGRPYVLGKSDCARLVCDVRREVFGMPVPEEAEPERAASLTGRFNQMGDGVAEYGERRFGHAARGATHGADAKSLILEAGAAESHDGDRHGRTYFSSATFSA